MCYVSRYIGAWCYLLGALVVVPSNTALLSRRVWVEKAAPRTARRLGQPRAGLLRYHTWYCWRREGGYDCCGAVCGYTVLLHGGTCLLLLQQRHMCRETLVVMGVRVELTRGSEYEVGFLRVSTWGSIAAEETIRSGTKYHT